MLFLSGHTCQPNLPVMVHGGQALQLLVYLNVWADGVVLWSVAFPTLLIWSLYSGTSRQTQSNLSLMTSVALPIFVILLSVHHWID